MDQKLSLDDLRGAFGGLSDTHHQILVMRELDGLSYRQIGERLGMSRASVEPTLFRARRRLTEEYEGLISGERCLRVQAIVTGAVGAPSSARDWRRMVAHLSHCQPCRRRARAVGLDVPVPVDRAARSRVAAFLPLPAFLRRGTGGADVASAGATHGGLLTQWVVHVGASMDPVLLSWLKAATVAVTIAIVGVGAARQTALLTRPVDRAGIAPAATPVTHATSPTRPRLPALTPGVSGSRVGAASTGLAKLANAGAKAARRRSRPPAFGPQPTPSVPGLPGAKGRPRATGPRSLRCPYPTWETRRQRRTPCPR